MAHRCYAAGMTERDLSEMTNVELLRELLTRRRDGEFVSDEEGRRQTQEMIARKRKLLT